MNGIERSAGEEVLLDLAETNRLVSAARMRFRRDAEQSFLTVVAARSGELLPELYLLLTSLGVQVVGVRAHSNGRAVIQELELSGRDGAPLDDDQWRIVQAAAMGYVGDRLLSRPDPRPSSERVSASDSL